VKYFLKERLEFSRRDKILYEQVKFSRDKNFSKKCYTILIRTAPIFQEKEHHKKCCVIFARTALIFQEGLFQIFTRTHMNFQGVYIYFRQIEFLPV